ncbi:hypothetical protein AQUCO_01300440v1 [Aquilegia coerulea]|uniref:DUF4378 domain-containing protein n=1 Tax=Aquilegia coerulea TaxID=218851 RepID=A0A2G5E298_AQUCA|nr:hypothetical protein AQUCO_01300440v1 [Aquilegia coerulea]
MEIERRITRKPPAMLKEFLKDDFSSCSSSGFRSFPRRSCYTSVRNLLELDLKARDSRKPRKVFQKEVKITAFQKATMAMINVVKHFQFSQKQSILPRSLSRRLKRSFTKKSDKEIKREISVVVKVKDILRWKSFRDVAIEEKKKQLDYSASPMQTTITNTTTTTTTSSNSWSDSDFTSEYLHSWSCSSENSGENNEIEECKKYLPEKNKISKTRCNEVVEDSMEKSHGEEKDQFSPVSVLDFPFEEDDESLSSSFQSSLENMERTKHKLMQKIRRFESLAKIEPLDLEKRITSLEHDDSSEYPSDSQSNSVSNDVEVDQEEDEEYIMAEQKARELLKLFNGPTSKECLNETTNGPLLDFFREEVMERNHHSKKSPKGDELDQELLKVAKDWMNGNIILLDWTVESSREVHVTEMERGGKWRDVEEEKKELAIEMEMGVLNILMDEMLCDLLS